MSMTDTNAPGPITGPQASLNQLRERVNQLASGFSRGQRTTLTVAALAVVGLIMAVSYVKSNVDYAPLYTQLTSSDVGAVTKKLQEQGVDYRIAGSGDTVEVPRDQVYQLRADLADVKLTGSGKVGYGILDDQGLTTSEFGQRVGFQRAMEGELGKTIEAIDGVESAVVHLAIPKDQVFALDQQKATASVMVKTTSPLGTEQVEAIRNLVASGIESMTSDDVSVADSQGHVLAAPGGAASGQSGVTDQRQATYQDSVATAIENMLAASVGPGKVKATVAADLDFDQTATTKESYSPSPVPSGSTGSGLLPQNESTKTEVYGGSGAAPAGTLGNTDPTVDPTTGASTSGTGYNLNERQVNYLADKTTETTSKAPGTVKRLSVALLLDEKAIGEDKVAQIEQLVNAAANIDPARGDSVVVTRLPFDETTQNQLQSELDAHTPTAASSDMMMVYGAAGALALLVLISTFLILRKRKKDLIELEDLAEQAALLGPDPGGLAPTTANPIISLTGGAAGRPGDPTITLDRRREDRREVLGELIDNQPDEVAQLLRGWLGDRRAVSR